MRKRGIALLMVLLLALPFIGCSAGKTDSTATTAGDVSQATTQATTAAETEKQDLGPLRIMWWGSQTRHDRTLAVLDLYTEQTGVAFEPEFYGFDDYITKLNTLIAAADGPDLMQMGGNFPTYQEHIEYLNPYIDSGAIDTKNTEPSMIGITTLEGNIIGLSSGVNAPAMAYDPALFEKAGAAMPTFKWTWEEYEKAAGTIHEKLGILGTSQTQNNEFEILTTVVTQYNTGESLFKEPYRLELNYNDDKYVVDFLEMVNRMTKAGSYPTPARMAEIKDIEGDPLVKGESAMTWLYSNQFVALSNAANRPLKLVCAPRRTADGPLSLSITSSQMFCMYNKSQHKDAAAKFISFFINDEHANLILKGERGIPIMSNVRDILKTGLSDAEKEIYSYIDALAKEASTDIVLNSPVQTEIRDTYIRVAEEFKFGKSTAAQAAAKFKEEAGAVIDRYNKSK